ncbi:protein SpAN-like isoform X2 [Hyposmocoma kahamanoa]|uniref:protein SpAN-like isoform X2 n=1 Tax=Hyposmocoma kahamanoa TaxID=1477025 RepID=UPI000E6D6C18|nr:protein SpAN-like isoform X2 [Hyposmocoma kahamanoa]
MRSIILSRCLLIVITVLSPGEGFVHISFSNPYTDIKNQMVKVRDKVTSVVADLVFKANGIDTLSLPIKKKLTLTDVNQEPGFSLTKEEMVKFKIWDKGIIPFFIDEYSFDKVLRDRIRMILDEVNAATGVQFMEIPSPPIDEKEKYVLFINRREALRCVDHTTNDFTNEGVQRVVLGYDCIDLQTGMAALILTLLGVPPQHNAPNRDHYIEVITNNIIPDKLSYFTKLQNTDWLFHDIEYDFESASHYPYHMYSAHGASTIRPKWHVDETSPVGENRALSINDILKIKMLYSYIMKHSSDKMHAACSHMFQPGNAFSNHQAHKFKVISARQKPNKYLGNDPFQNLSENDGNDDVYTY